MPQLDFQKEIESLKKQISDLEKKVSDKKSNVMFGRSYSQIGSSDSDFVIKTKGLVKILWGNKFIDLIKDGKINVDSKFIFSVNTADDIGVKNGIYVTLDGSVYLKTGESIINLVGEIGVSYVSFMSPQNTTSNQKLTALKNIGFIYDDMSTVDSSVVLNGIIYLLSEQKLYTIKDGALSEFSVEFPTPFTLLFVILKKDQSQGALVIKGSGINNSLAFESLYIYNDDGNPYFQSDGNILFAIDLDVMLEITKDGSIFKVNVASNMFQSVGAERDSGFRLYTDSLGSTLEVDNIVVRNLSSDVNTIIFPNYWSLENNVITRAEQILDSSLGTGYALTLKYENLYRLGDKLYVYGEVKVDDFRERLVKIPIEVGMIDTEIANTIYVLVLTGISSDVDNLTELPNLVGLVTFLVSSDAEIALLRYLEQNIDLLKYTLFDEESKKESIRSRIGNLTELLIKRKEDLQEITIDGLGIYSLLAAFLEAQYVSEYELPENDNSTRFASTEWVNRLVPKGVIMMFNGDTSNIPEGWAICDGSNGTPNLINKFIKAGISSGETGGSEEVTLTVDNIPTHYHTLLGTINTSENGEHQHTYTSPKYGLLGGSDNVNIIESTEASTTEASGSHYHSIDLSGVITSDVGNGSPIKIEPQYYSLIFIMKII